MMGATRSDVIILGGGIIGTTTAYFLSKDHGKSVTLLERELVGRQATGTNFGGVRRQGRPPQQMAIAHRALEIWSQSRRLLGEDLEFQPYGHLRVCYTQERADMFADYAREIRQAGLHLKLLDRRQLRDHLGIFDDRILMGSLSPGDGHANPRIAGPAFARAARRYGARVHEHTRATQVEKDDQGFKVTTGCGRTWSSEQLLIACGAWSATLSAQFGERVPLEFHAPAMGVTEPLPFRAGPIVAISSANVDESVYFRQIERGNIVIGGGRRAGVDLERARAFVDQESILRQFRALRTFVPAFRNVQLIRAWSGVESYTPDRKPVVGKSARTAGLYFAFGFSGEGFGIGPGVGNAMATLISSGRSEFDLSPYDISRFEAQA